MESPEVHSRSPVRPAGCPCPGKGSGDQRKGRQSASAIQGRSHCNGGTTARANDRGDRATVQHRLHGCGSPWTSGEGLPATLKVSVDTSSGTPRYASGSRYRLCYGAGTKLRLQRYIHTLLSISQGHSAESEFVASVELSAGCLRFRPELECDLTGVLSYHSLCATYEGGRGEDLDDGPRGGPRHPSHTSGARERRGCAARRTPKSPSQQLGHPRVGA
ncbi:hypothetical protein HDV57DRAFT_46909 [Trichoderma longibrachiatum]|uniref:Uncharacterized protein n=1 Tax=Trichoderma longibrachiatum ATCC 18648 TaxID=983965 RepID=A0A2T4CH72_TRILO|nr:hypothetical protein M440DRAFT_70754 [Trichoderma longibrachiatum ATCC 18648]